jgi:hypothetical protein
MAARMKVSPAHLAAYTDLKPGLLFNSLFDHLWIAGTTLSIFAEFANGTARSLWKRDEMSIRIE